MRTGFFCPAALAAGRRLWYSSLGKEDAMISIDRFQEILEDLAEELPVEFYDELNGGILVDPGHPLHPADEHGDLYIMGEYRVDPAMGKYIVMFYGSFRRVMGDADEAEWIEEMRDVLRHEFRHHIEGRAGVRDLEIWDEQQIAAYRAENREEE